MRVRIGGLEIEDVTLDELDEIVRRYGGEGSNKRGESPPADRTPSNSVASIGSATSDAVLLRRFAESVNGLLTKEVGILLGKKGKAIQIAAKAWAKRVGLIQDEGLNPFETCRIGTSRGMRINGHLRELAQALNAKGKES